jgi:hypothetical protein
LAKSLIFDSRLIPLYGLSTIWTGGNVDISRGLVENVSLREVAVDSTLAYRAAAISGFYGES